ncbi:hypothetical protein [Nitrospira sp. Nam80]
MAGIFLSYRRSDSAHVAGRMFDRLKDEFGPDMVFKDVDSIPLSVSFPDFLKAHLERVDVVLALIGEGWFECKGPNGGRRLDDPKDYVRMELETALDLGIPTVPIMLSFVTWGQARAPHPDALPDKLKPLAYKNGQELRPDPDFHRDMDRLVRRLRPLMNSVSPISQKRLDSESLHEILMCVQEWHNEIVRTAASLKSASGSDARDSIQFVYVNTRSFLPRLLSLRRLVKRAGDSEVLAKAIDQFVDLVTFTREDGGWDQFFYNCCPISLHRDDSRPDGLLTDSYGLRQLHVAVQAVCDAVTSHSASRGKL